VNLINCKKCGVLFQKKLRDICDKCLEKENKSVEQIEKYIKNCSAQFISFEMINQKTGIELEEIEELYKKGRLTIITDRLLAKCKICGVEIKCTQGKSNFCAKCLNEVLSEDGGRKPILDPKNVNVDLRRFDKDIMHTNKIISPEERMKYGFKKSYE
jgi:hypothetical protein